MSGKDAYGFMHDANARNDVRLLRLRARFGLEGLGWYWCVIEMLRETSDYSLPLDSVEGLAMSLCITTELFDALLKASVDLRLLDQDGLSFRSPSLVRRMDKFNRKRDQLRANALQMHSKRKADAEHLTNLTLPNLELEDGSKDQEKRQRPYQHPDARGNPRSPHPKFPLLWFSPLELTTIENRFAKAGLLPEYHTHAFMKVEQWFQESGKGRKTYPQSSNHMRRVIDWGLKAALELQRTSDSAKLANGRLR